MDASHAEQWLRVLWLQDYNTRVVVFGTAMLGLAAGAVGSFTLLRRRALMGDALSHATLPGIGLAFMFATTWGLAPRTLWTLLLGGTLSGVLGMGAILWLRRWTRLKEDTAMGIILSVFFGAGIAILGMVQQMTTGHQAGLEAFIYGKTASMLPSDAWMIAGAGVISGLTCTLLFKELKLLCFDSGFAASRGYPVLFLDLVLMANVILITMIGLQAVGLILMIALLTIPAAAARFWTQRMHAMTLIAAVCGMVSSAFGSAISAVYPRLPSGAMIVLVAATVFLFSMLFGSKRGIVLQSVKMWQLTRRVEREHVLRGLYEQIETVVSQQPTQEERSPPIPLQTLLATRSWTPLQLQRALNRAEREGMVLFDGGTIRLTRTGMQQGAKLARDHRLWELYLITHADIAPAQVDRSADAIEHVLTSEMIHELEAILNNRQGTEPIPASPHPLRPS